MESQYHQDPYKLVVYHEEMNPRRRSTMEDVHRIVPHLVSHNGSSYAYFGVYDGHGGRQIVDFLEDALEKSIARELEHDDDAEIPERLTRAFLITDMESKKCKLDTSGATVVSGLLKYNRDSEGKIINRILYTANAGDSRAVLVYQQEVCGRFQARRLSFDHRTEEESEQKRIKEAGGFITKSRVLGILAVTRSFGDHGMKDFVSAEPYISETNIDEFFNCPMLILACDGVWDVFSDQEAADLLMKRYLEVGPYPEAAELLVSLMYL